MTTPRIRQRLLVPVLPEPGTTMSIFGINARVIQVVPDDDWHWTVELESVSSTGTSELWTVTLPTDYRTTDGRPAGAEYDPGHCSLCGLGDATEPWQNYGELLWMESLGSHFHQRCADAVTHRIESAQGRLF